MSTVDMSAIDMASVYARISRVSDQTALHPFPTWGEFLAAHRDLMEVLADELDEEAHLPLAWFDVLGQLSLVADGTLRMQELSRRLLGSKSGLSKLFSRIEVAGLVRRQPCPEDLRGTFATLTDAGRAALKRALPVHQRGIQRYFMDPLTEEELRSFSSGLPKIRAAARPSR